MASVLRADAADFDGAVFDGASCAFGVFDGVHRGHQYLLRCTQETARRSGGRAIALTFDIDPDELFHPERLKTLLSNEDRLAALAASGVDTVVVLPFTRAFAASSPQEFLARTFGGHAPAFLHVGSNFRFGARALGRVEDLRAWGAAAGTEVRAHDLKSEDGAPISATRIRLLLAKGDLDEANKLLGRPYQLRGTVLRGRGEGGAMGFHTANLAPSFAYRVLGEGVYAGYADLAGVRYRAAVSVGVSPVFAGETDASCEVHVLDFSGDLYGSSIVVSFVKYLRPMIKFDTVDDLIVTVNDNIRWTRENLPL